jgi:uncharacterized membrane protein YidH (DUF202 family)
MSMEVIWKRVKNEWFHTRTAIVLFVTSAAIVMLGFAFGELWPRNIIISRSLAAQLSFSLAMMMWAFSTLVVTFGMFRYWTVGDRSSRMVHRTWLVIMIVGFLLGLGLGPALYCFAVYLPQALKTYEEPIYTEPS